jgi:HAMP domain-containing protein
MSPGRSFFLNRINAQLAILILASLLVIHAVITASIFFSNRWNNAAAFDGDPAEFVSLVRLVAGAPADRRAPLLKQIAHSFPDLKLQAATVMLPPRNGAGVDRRLDFLNQRLSPGFHVVAAPSVARSGRDAAMFDVAVRLPDGTALKARLRPRAGLPFLIGPITVTVLFIVISVTLLGLWAARALHRPLSRFAKAADGFDLDGEITELPERGPEEIRAVAKAFNQMRERIKKLVDDRTRMLAAMGHDLRTPITRLRLRSEFIAENELRAQMLRDLDQMRAMTDGVLSFLRDEQTREAATSMDLATTLQTVCDQFADLGHAVT